MARKSLPNQRRAVSLIALMLGSLLMLPATTSAIDIVCSPASPVASPGTTPEFAIASESIPFPTDAGTLTIFAAASLVDAFAVIESDLESAYSELDIVVETAGSHVLVTQLIEGAEADVLATASIGSMTSAIDAGVVTAKPQTFIGNRLVLVTPADNPAGLESFEDLADDGLLLVIAGKDVPAGQYAREAICSGDADFVTNVGNNVVSEEENVRNVLAKVQIGQADAGIVYASDATAATIAGAEIKVIEFPETIDTTTAYPIAPVFGGNDILANAFVSYILSPDGQQTLLDHGFTHAG